MLGRKRNDQQRGNLWNSIKDIGGEVTDHFNSDSRQACDPVDL